MSDCESSQTWIWEVESVDELPPQPISDHIDGCTPCQGELRARRDVARDLRALRFALDEAPPQRTDRAVLMGVGEAMVQEQEAFLPPASITTEVHHHHGGHQAPRATPSWMLAAAAILFVALGSGFFAGRMSVPPAPVVTTAPAGVTALATFHGQDVHKMHTVGLRQAGLQGLMAGDTWLLTGPRGGPYRVVGRVNVDQLDTNSLPSSGNEEIVVAVASEGQWSADKRLALNDLSDPGVSILARRSLSQR
ncbi:MAG: hypothetical protein KDA24_05950 [Deltaproteobacteria bacterium]|nr:hypothetical protein [Deltaproteobacteria bacterium]